MNGEWLKKELQHNEIRTLVKKYDAIKADSDGLNTKEIFLELLERNTKLEISNYKLKEVNDVLREDLRDLTSVIEGMRRQMRQQNLL